MMLYLLGSMESTRAGMKKGRSRAKSHYLMWIAQTTDTFTPSLSVPLGSTENGALRKKSLDVRSKPYPLLLKLMVQVLVTTTT